MEKRTRRLIICSVIVCIVLAFGAGGYVLAQRRLAQERAGIGAVGAPSMPEAIAGAQDRNGAFEVEVSYTAMNAPKGAHAKTVIAWDDDWFFSDPTEYNHELATTCSVLSAIANSESAYYQAGSEAPAFMENTLASLGFEDISTASYQYRSEVLDEVLDFFTQSDDVVAYSVASKRVVNSQTGEEKTLLLVSVRGSYGSEWLSDVNMGDPAELDLDTADHKGFAVAAEEIVSALEGRVTTLSEERGGDATEEIALLFTGHSRGAAAANLAASYADDMTAGLRPIAPIDSIYAYTFATPELTLMDNTGDALYDNIFNILNPSDMVPRMPLAAWGFDRYGHDLWLPEPGMENFEALFEDMEAHYLVNVGAENPSEPADATRVDEFQQNMGKRIATKEDFITFGGIAATVRLLVGDMNAMQVLCSHYPNTYIAWMQSIEAADLRSER